MTTSNQRAGKTAPRLIQDLHLYDFQHPPASGRNLLSETPPTFPQTHSGPSEWLSPAACNHNYTLKPNQTSVLPSDQRRGRGAVSTVSAVCSLCRCHLQLKVSYPGNAGPRSTHLHHLVYKSGNWKNGRTTPKGQQVESYYYACSYSMCGISVSVDIMSPVLRPEHVQLLTDLELVNKRADEAVAAHPERLEGIARPLPVTVLSNLSAYLNNALHDSQRSKPISAVNKRFVVCFGVDGLPCKDLLTYLGFSSPNEGFWNPPIPDASAEKPYRDELSVFLDNAIHEISVLIQQRPAVEKKTPYSLDPLEPARNELFDALEATNYSKASRLIEFQMPGQPCYEDLGALEDMSSDLVIEAYQRQVAVDPANGPHYLQCLRVIAELRGGPDASTINEVVMMEYSKGAYTTEDLRKAYLYFGLNGNDPSLTEELIVGRFYSFISSSSQETEARQQLFRIGDARNSERIKSVAEDRVSTAEQAQVFLGVEENTPDDFVITMYTTKINDSPSSKPIAQKALSLIAEARNSEALRHFIATGESRAGEMDVGDAYRLLQIPDRTVGDDAIIAAYTICVDEAPAQVETYSRALALIAKEKESPMLSSFVSGSVAHSDRNLAEWPVGLQNIGNTCYLNSLLQFYFTIKPYRGMVLEFEDAKTDLSEDSLREKKVGSRKVSRFEVERSQKFLRELRTLFQNMITTPRASVRPEQELARLTLISSTNEAEIRRRSTVSGARPSLLGEIGGLPVAGPLGPPQPAEANAIDADTEMVEEPVAVEGTQRKDPVASDIDSEATLVSEPTNVKEEHSSARQALEGSPTSENHVASPNDEPNPSPEQVEPPNRPPPVPPRPTEIRRDKQIIEEVELGAQQDVTEVINNVLFQSECAIKPRALEADGEQVDIVKDLFYGKTKSYITAKKEIRSKEESWSDIKIDVATGPRDIYTAIDGAFDIQDVLVNDAMAEQFGSISKIPPILQIQVQRVQFDPIKKVSFKSTHHLDLKETIYLDRYMDTQKEEIINRRRECWNWKKKLRSLETRKAELLRLNEADGQSMPTLFKNASNLLENLSSMDGQDQDGDSSLDIDAHLASEMEQFSQITQTELAYIEQEMKDTQTMISSQFSDSRHLAYRLYAVFMHQGSVEFGHYYIYIYDFNREVWRKYNDNEITEVQDTSEIFGKSDRASGRANPPTPYFLVYVNAAMKNKLVEPVCREIVPEQSTVTATSAAAEQNNTDGLMDVDTEPSSSQRQTWVEPPADDNSSNNVHPSSTPTLSPTSIPLKRKGSGNGEPMDLVQT